MNNPIRIVRRCKICGEEYFLKYFARKFLHSTTISFIKKKYRSEKSICNFCVHEIFYKNTRPSEKFLFKINEQKRTDALYEVYIASQKVD